MTYQVGDLVQAYDGHIGIVIYTHKEASSTFPNDQRVWIKCSNGSIMDAVAEYFRVVIDKPPERVKSPLSE